MSMLNNQMVPQTKSGQFPGLPFRQYPNSSTMFHEGASLTAGNPAFHCEMSGLFSYPNGNSRLQISFQFSIYSWIGRIIGAMLKTCVFLVWVSPK